MKAQQVPKLVQENMKMVPSERLPTILAKFPLEYQMTGLNMKLMKNQDLAPTNPKYFNSKSLKPVLMAKAKTLTTKPPNSSFKLPHLNPKYPKSQFTKIKKNA